MTDIRQALEEAWEVVNGSCGLYEVSSLGRVRSVKSGLVLNPAPPKTNRTYAAISLHLPAGRVRRSVHRLVAEAFLEKPDGTTLVRHINGNNADNRAINLAWGTAKDNSHDRDRHGRTAVGDRHGMKGSIRARGTGNGFARLTDDMVREIRKLYGSLNQYEIADRFQIHQSTVQRILNRKAWSHVV